MAATPIVLDACSSLNLFASGIPLEIAKAANVQFLLLPEVQMEAKHLFGPPDKDGVRPLEPIDWPSFLKSGIAASTSFPEEALDALVSAARQLSDVDAKCVALANHLKVGLLSDDGKVRKVFTSSGGSGLLSTVSTIRVAAAKLPLDKSAVRSIFGRIRERARFEPSRKDPEYRWYVSQIGDSEQ